ncbi:hypothetical protein [Pedobacter immunditicola]|uniref:hypothetical protein n=1 Tax=Pedobacter immunditicola TaxID=3133440 RepID=UPI0030A18331
MEKIEMKLNSDEFNAILQNGSSIEDFLRSIFTNQDTGSSRLIGDQLLRYYSAEGGNPQIESFSLRAGKYDHVTKTGSVSFQFKVKFWLSCSSLEQEQSGQETIKFTVNADQTSITLVFPQFEERSTHDEF